MASENIGYSDEKLSEAVRAYPCIFDKADAGHKDRQVVANAWEAIANKLGKSTKEVNRLFDNLKKRFLKRRNDLKLSKRSGTSREAKAQAQKKMDQFNFMIWLEPFIKIRAT